MCGCVDCNCQGRHFLTPLQQTAQHGTVLRAGSGRTWLVGGRRRFSPRACQRLLQRGQQVAGSAAPFLQASPIPQQRVRQQEGTKTNGYQLPMVLQVRLGCAAHTQPCSQAAAAHRCTRRQLGQGCQQWWQHQGSQAGVAFDCPLQQAHRRFPNLLQAQHAQHAQQVGISVGPAAVAGCQQRRRANARVATLAAAPQ